jgi:hypothetical protein
MSVLKAAIKILYLTFRAILYPIILAFRRTEIRRESLVAVFTVQLFVFLIWPLVRGYLGPEYGIESIAIGAVLGYLFMVWGKEFEERL